MLRVSLFAAALSLSFFACGAPESSTTTTTTSQTCNERHECINGACQCTEGPKKGSSCCDPNDSSCSTNKCDTYCKYCQ